MSPSPAAQDTDISTDGATGGYAPWGGGQNYVPRFHEADIHPALRVPIAARVTMPAAPPTMTIAAVILNPVVGVASMHGVEPTMVIDAAMDPTLLDEDEDLLLLGGI